MTDPHTLDVLAVLATPAPTTRTVEGWLAKSAPGLPFRRANAVLPCLGAGDDPRTPGVLHELEHWYADGGRRTLVQVSSADPDAKALDALLAARGWAVEAPVEVLVAPVSRLLDEATDRSRAAVAAVAHDIGDPAWVERGREVHVDDERAGDRVGAYARMLAPLGPAAVAISATHRGTPAGVGVGVVASGWLGVFGMGTATTHRRRGVARSVLRALAEAGRAAGAPHTYLQVEEDNDAARALYRSVGFRLSHRYHYRVSSPPP